MADDRIPGTTTKPTGIAEGLPPAPHQHVQVQPDELDAGVNDPTEMQVFFAWEKLRILYDIIMIPVIILALVGTLYLHMSSFFSVILACNLFFCSGMVAEGYQCCCGINRKVARLCVFVVWLLFSIWAVWFVFVWEGVQRWPVWLGFPAH